MEERNDQEELEKEISRAVKKGVRKAGRTGRILRTILILIAAGAVLFGYFRIKHTMDINTTILADVSGHDLTLENNGIFGYKAADFGEVILGEAKRQANLIVDEKEVSVPTEFTDAGFMDWGIFSKTQNFTICGTGQYTIDLTRITQDDITYDPHTYTVTIAVPYPELHAVNFDPSKTVIGDAERGLLAFGSIEMTMEQQKEFETKAVEKLTSRCRESDCFEEAERFAKLSATEVYQPLVSGVNPAAKVVITVRPQA